MNTFHPMTIFAMGTPPSGSGQGAPGGGSSGILMIGYMAIIFALFYFMMIRPQQQQAKKRTEMLNMLKVGSDVVTIGGLHGSITAIEDTTIRLKVASGVELTFNRSAIGSVRNPS